MWGTLGGSSGTRLVVSAHFIRLWKIVTIVLLYMYAISPLIEVSEHRLEPIFTSWLLMCTMPSPELLAKYSIAWSWLLVTCPMVWPGLLMTCPIAWSGLLVMCPIVWSGTVSLVSTWDDGEIIYIHMKFTLNSNIPILTIWRVKWVQILLHPPIFRHPGQKINLLYNLSHYVTFN